MGTGPSTTAGCAGLRSPRRCSDGLSVGRREAPAVVEGPGRNGHWPFDYGGFAAYAQGVDARRHGPALRLQPAAGALGGAAPVLYRGPPRQERARAGDVLPVDR